MSAFVNFNDENEWNELSAEINAVSIEFQNDIIQIDNDWAEICAGIEAYGEEYQTSIDIHDYEGLQSELSEEDQDRLSFKEMHIYLLQMLGYTYTEAEIIVEYYDSI
jgi:hypothetical protein